jgi:hypothetical protein
VTEVDPNSLESLVTFRQEAGLAPTHPTPTHPEKEKNSGKANDGSLDFIIFWLFSLKWTKNGSLDESLRNRK